MKKMIVAGKMKQMNRKQLRKSGCVNRRRMKKEVELNEDVAMEYLAESKGECLEEFRESLTPREQKKYAPEMEKFEFIRKNWKYNYEDFKETQKDWSAESNESRLRNYLKLSNLN
jgi:hypothetical protein